MISKADLVELANNDRLLYEVARLAIEDTLIELRDDRISTPARGNGLVVREKDGSPSNIIRLGPEHAMKIGLLAIAEQIED